MTVINRSDSPDQCIHRIFEQQVERTPDAPAVIFEDRQLTYRQLNRQANQLAHHLRRRGTGPDTPVGICMERSVEMMVGVLGILKAGGAYVPLDPAYPKERLEFMLADTQSPLLLMHSRLRNLFATPSAQVINLDADWDIIARECENNPQAEVCPENLAYVIYTSGSTGKPKGVAMPHRPLHNLIDWQSSALPLAPGGRVVQFSPISFDVSFQEMFSTWCAGGLLVLVSDSLRRDPSQFLAFLDQHAIGRLFLPFTALRQLAEVAEQLKILPSRLREIITAGEQLQLTPPIARLLSGMPDCVLHNHYGPSETHVATAFTLGKSPDQWSVLPPIGRPIANVQVHILDFHLQPAPVGVEGEIYIGGAAPARGYLNRPDLTAERFIPDPFSAEPGGRLYKTGDLARRLPDGNIEFLGRIDDQVKIRGFRVEPGEIEVSLGRHPAVRQSVVVAREDGTSGKRLVAYVVPADAQSSLSIEDLRCFLKKELPEHMIPSAFVFLQTLPLTPSGKVDRKSLPAPDADRPRMDQSYAAPRTPVEKQLAEIWSQVLGVRQVGVGDNFFDLGGHSMLAVQLSVRVEKAMGVVVPLTRIFADPTIKAMAAAINNRQPSQSDDPLVPLRTSGSRPPLFLVPGIGGHAVGLGKLAALLDADQSAYGLQPRGLDGQLPPHRRIEEMAEYFIRALRRVAPSGPYYLAGYSVGGVVVYEMARQLRNFGQRIALLGMFDSYGPGFPRMSPLIVRLGLHARAFVAKRPRAAIDYFQARFKAIHRRLQHRPEALPINHAGETGSISAVIENVGRAWQEALQCYRPSPCDVHITIFKAIKQPVVLGTHYNDPSMGWGKLAKGGTETCMVSGDHDNLFNAPHLAVLAEKLCTCLGSLQTTAEPVRP